MAARGRPEEAAVGNHVFKSRQDWYEHPYGNGVNCSNLNLDVNRVCEVARFYGEYPG